MGASWSDMPLSMQVIVAVSTAYIIYRVYSVVKMAQVYYRSQVEMDELVHSPALRGARSPWRGKSVLVIVNPFSGGSTGEQVYEALVDPLLELAGVSATLALTQGPGDVHRLLVGHNVASGLFDAIMVGGGDGTLHEVINALMDVAPDVAASIPLMMLPLGTSNGMVRTLGETDVLRAAALALSHKPAPLDTWSVDIVPFGPDASPVSKTDVFMMSWAMVAEHDEYQERRLRWMGPLLASLAAPLVTIGLMNVYEGSIAFLPHDEAAAAAAARGHDYYTDPTTLPAVDPPAWYTPDDDSPPGPWRVYPHPVALCSAVNVPWVASDATFSPGAHPNDGALDLCILDARASRLDALGIFLALSDGSHTSRPHVTIVKAAALDLVPARPSPLSLSGEVIPFGHIRIKVNKGALSLVRPPSQ